jgi:Mg2+ and Co2+ transporter CorA
MLRSELPLAIDTGSGRALAVALGEPFLGFLAIVALALTLFPMLFAVPPTVYAGIEAGQWAIIAWFSVELVVAFAFAADKRVFLANPWRWLDFATVLVGLASLLPSATAALRSAPILRLARIGRLVSFGVRASGLPARRRRVETAKVHGPARVRRLVELPQPAAELAELDDLWRWLAAPDEQWFHVAGPTADELRRIGEAADLPAGFLEQHLLGTNYPHWAPAGPRTGLFLWLPELDATGHLERFAILLVPTGRGLLSLSRHALPSVLGLTGAPADGDERSFTERMIGRVLERVVRDYHQLAGRSEERLRELEDVPVHESRPAFFELTFRMKKQLSAAQSDLWRLKRIAADLVARRAAGAAAVEVYTRFENDIDYLYDTMINVREGVLSVIDLHLNVVSFEMNRVMRVLAVVSALGLIPAIVGGLLGMNLADSPWMVTLPQVAFAVFFGMVIGLYFFVIKGWLR